jgi:SAM-dependent methyltransferase
MMTTADAALTRPAATRTPRDWLEAYVSTYYFCPSLALWRSLEAQALGAEPFTGPSLDVGAFDGSFAAAWLGDRPAFDVGLDLRPIRSRASSRAYRSLVTADGQRLPFADNTFNFVLCNSVIEHLPDDQAAMSEMARVLRPGGTLLLSTPSVYFHDSLDGVRAARRRGDEAAAVAYMNEMDRRALHLRYRSLADWTGIVNDVGLRLAAHSYCVPPEAAAAWDRWDTWGITRVGGRDLHGYMASRKLARVVPPAFWRQIFMRLLESEYMRAVAVQNSPDSVGVSLVFRAVKD